MRVLGIDPGSAVTGYGIVHVAGSGYNALDYGCIRPPAKERLSTRRLLIFEGLCHLMDLYEPDVVSIETQFVLHNVRTALTLGMVRGIAILASTQRQIAVYEYTPSQAKQAVSGKGNATKSQVQGMVQKLLNLPSPPKPEDAADALALAICHVHAAQGSRELQEV